MSASPPWLADANVADRRQVRNAQTPIHAGNPATTPTVHRQESHRGERPGPPPRPAMTFEDTVGWDPRGSKPGGAVVSATSRTRAGARGASRRCARDAGEA